ncbi:hypothetical protein TM1040_0785 [Ruegeria sp. TM1040]|uniref:hypothetical protein n=1 Tax=Ruegeria sp. (strain TM1040) TaxID=292414 RepID=UPI0000462663|nr:hypothetical protein [Ruegeria sp. TM1040]ABF63518.1 hypothetical protein TM1040_0785 [Ruegeria sp. TM1040]
MSHLSNVTPIRTPAAKSTTHATHTRRRGSHDWSAGPWKHPAPTNGGPDRKNWTLTLTFWALMIFVAILTAVSVGASLSNPL